MDRFIELASGATTIGLLAIADRSGLNQHMADGEQRTAEEISRTSDLDQRYVREILSGLAAAGVYEYDADSTAFRLPPEHTVLVADETSPYFMGGWFDMIPSLYGQLDGLVSATRNGGGVPFSDFGPDMIRGITRGNQPSQTILLNSKWLPAVPGLIEALRAGIRVADVGCGVGNAIKVMAHAFPKSDFIGYDISPEEIAMARRDVTAPNVTFELAGVEDLPTTPGFDLITSFDVIHDLVDPDVGLASIRRALTQGGRLLMMEPAASSKLEENLTPRAALLYGVSTMHCMTQSLARGGKGVGTAWGRQEIEAAGRKAGFMSVTRLEGISNTFSDFFLLS